MQHFIAAAYFLDQNVNSLCSNTSPKTLKNHSQSERDKNCLGEPIFQFILSWTILYDLMYGSQKPWNIITNNFHVTQSFHFNKPFKLWRSMHYINNSKYEH